MVDYIFKAKEFMKWKAKVLGLPELADDWILDWLDEQGDVFCKTWLLDILDYTIRRFYDDSDLCPFCQVYLDSRNKCSGCPWKDKHGDCNDRDSFYWRTTHDDDGEICKYWKRIGVKKLKIKMVDLLMFPDYINKKLSFYIYKCFDILFDYYGILFLYLKRMKI